VAAIRGKAAIAAVGPRAGSRAEHSNKERFFPPHIALKEKRVWLSYFCCWYICFAFSFHGL